MVLVELCYFYRHLCAKEITVEMMEKLKRRYHCFYARWIFFPPRFFNPMQHLLIHLSYEAKVHDPVQYRWMYNI
jgi:hypothetical protein